MVAPWPNRFESAFATGDHDAGHSFSPRAIRDACHRSNVVTIPAADIVATVTPGKHVLFREGSLRPGQHVSLMGADGPGKSEIAVQELARVHVFCDDWIQASHNGDLVHAVESGALRREDVTELGAVLAGLAPGRRSHDDITVFDSTGLAIQDLAVALAALERVDDLALTAIEL